jgi:hypothetical protein
VERKVLDDRNWFGIGRKWSEGWRDLVILKKEIFVGEGEDKEERKKWIKEVGMGWRKLSVKQGKRV